MAQAEIFKIMGSVLLQDEEFTKGIKNVLNEANNTATKLSQKFSTIGNGLKNVGSKISNVGAKVTAGTTALVGSVAMLTKSSIAAYADYEQLVGGVETLFKKSSGKVLEYAQGAYESAGLSANDYMETVTSFSASLLQSLKGDTDKSAEYAHRAVTDMSDNANKMGTDMSMIQNAYQGFAKQNYTMLDNLKLGYGGTKTEMERLVKDASKLKGVQKELGITVDENSLSFANIVNAISVVQKNMGIMGTTTEEASGTITGSINAMKASWTNLLIGMADDNADFEALFNTFIDNLVTVAKNLAPRIEIVITTALKKVLEGIKSLTGNLPPVFGKIIDKLIWLADNFRSLDVEQKKQILSWIGMAVAIGPVLIGVGKLTSALGGIFSVISKIAGSQTIINLFTKLKGGITSLLHPVNLIKTAFGGLKTAFLNVQLFGSKLALLFNSSGGGLGGVMAILKTGVTSLGSAFTGLLGTIAPIVGIVLAVAGVFVVLKDNWDKVVQTFKNFIENTGLAEKFQEIKDKLQPLWEKIKGLKDLLTVVGTVIIGALTPAIGVLMGLFNAVVSAISPLLDALGGIIDILAGIGSFIVAIFTGDMEKAKESIVKIGQGIVNVFGGLWNAVKNFLKGFVDGVIGFFKGLWDTLVGHSIVPDTINSIIDWFKNLLGKPIEFVRNLKDKVVNFFGNLKDGVVNKAKAMASNVANKFSDMKASASEKLGNLASTVAGKFGDIYNKISEKMSNAKNKVSEMLGNMKSAFSNFTGKIKLPHFKISGSLNPAKWFEGQAPKLSVDWYAKGGIFDKPTLFNTAQGLKGVGEAGPEAVAPISKLQDYVRVAVDNSNAEMENKLETLINILLRYLPEIQQQQLVLDTGVLVGEMTTKLDRSLGLLEDKRLRGR